MAEDQDTDDLYQELSSLEQAMVSEEHQNAGTFLTGGNLAEDELELQEEQEEDENRILNPAPVKDGPELLTFLRGMLHKFDAPYAYIGGEANSPNQDRFKASEVKILIARLSTYESTSLSMSHSLMAQIYQELPYTFCDMTFLPKPNDYVLLKENGFPAWFGTNTKLGPDKFDVLSITHAVSMEQLNFVSLMHDSGIPLFKEQRMGRRDIPFVIVGGANSGTTAPLCGTYVTKDGRKFSTMIDAVIYGDGEQAAKQFIEVVREGKQKGWTKKQTLRACHGRVEGFYEPDMYEHVYEGSKLKEIKKKVDYVELPVRRATVSNLDEVRTLETKVLPFTGDGVTVDVSIAGSVGCIGSAGWGACSFCREGSEGPYRERTLPKVLEALDRATKNQGTKEVSFFSLNFNQYTDLFPLVAESVKRGYKVGLISQRVDMLSETPEQIRVQRWLKKSNYTLGVEGISGRMRAYLNKNLQEWELLKVCTEMMKEGASELKLFMIATGLENEKDTEECMAMMERVNAIRDKLGASTRFRISFTPLFPSAFTALQFAPAFAAIKHGSKSLNPIFNKAKELGWGRRLSVSGEEPLISNTINHGGRNIMPLLIASHFRDNYRFYGKIAKGTWLGRWKKRIEELAPTFSLEDTWGEKTLDYVFPWEDIAYSTSKEVLWRGYVKATAYQGISYCLTTRTVKGVCHVNECGACDPQKTGKPDPILIKNIVGRKVAPTIPVEKIAEMAKSREKANHMRVLFETNDPIYRFVLKGYFQFVIARALMLSSEDFTDAYVGELGHARIGAGANLAKDWTFGRNIYDFALSRQIPESELKALIGPANEKIREGRIISLRADNHMTVLRNDVDYALYSMLVPSSGMSFQRIQQDVVKFFERKAMGKMTTIKVKEAFGKGCFKTVEQTLEGEDVRQVSYQWLPEHRGTLMRFLISANYNPMSMLEAITGRKGFQWKAFPIYCDAYLQLAADEGETDVFAALSGKQTNCKTCDGPLEADLFTGEKLETGECLSCNTDQFPVRVDQFYTKQLTAVTVVELENAAFGAERALVP